jgi:hypothetical protein
VKAEAEKLLIDQFNKYSVQLEKAEAKANEALERSECQVKEAEEKVMSYESALARAEESLNEANERLRSEALARLKAEEMLRLESEERKRLEAEFEERIAAAEAKAEERVRSYGAALSEVQAKLVEAEGQVQAKSPAKSNDVPKAGVKEDTGFSEQPEDGACTFERTRRSFFHLGNIKRKFILLLVLVIFTTLTFALSVADNPPATEPDGIKMQDKTPERVGLAASNTDRKQFNTDSAADPSPGSLEAPAPDVTDSPSLNYEGSDDITFKADEEKRVPVSGTKLLTITARPGPFKITSSASGKNDIVEFSDDNRLETRVGSNIYYEFSDVSIPANAAIKSAVLFVEHFEEERFSEGKLEWSIGTGRPDRPAVRAVMQAPVHQGESSETVDAWDITSVVDTVEKINSLQLRIKNNNDVAGGRTFVDYAYVVVEYH